MQISEKIERVGLPAASQEPVAILPKTSSSTWVSLNSAPTVYLRSAWGAVLSILQFFFSLAKKIKSLFCKNFEQTDKAALLQSKEKAEISFPLSLSKEDPFFQLIFALDPQGAPILRNPETGRTAQKTFEKLGAEGPYEWALHYAEIHAMQKTLEEKKLHAFEFLFYILMPEKGATHLLNFKKSCESSKALQFALWITGRKQNPWEEFLEKQAVSFARQDAADNLFKMLSGFCTILNLEKGPLEEYIKQKNWKQCTLSIIEQRKALVNK